MHSDLITCHGVRCSVLEIAFELENNYQQKQVSTGILTLGLLRGSIEPSYLPLTLLGHRSRPLRVYPGTAGEFFLSPAPLKCVSLTSFDQWVRATYQNMLLYL